MRETERSADHSRSRRRSERPRRRPDKKQKRDRDKDKPHFSWSPGLALGSDGRYVVEKLLGDGTFGRVLQCLDRETGNKVAVKVVKGVKRFCKHAEDEAEVLEDIQEKDQEGASLCVRMLGSFLQPKHHFCIVFEPLGSSLRDFLKASGSKGLFMEDALAIAQQLLQSLSFLHGTMDITHTDLKCRNVMLKNSSADFFEHPRVPGAKTLRPRSCRIAVIDFGGAVYAEDRHDGRVGTRQFRGPEVVLGLPWDESSDMWSAGCIISMLYLGQRPISVHEDMEHIALIERLLEERIPTWMAKQASLGDVASEDFFTSTGRLNWPEKAPDEDAVERVELTKPLRQQVLPRHQLFLDLLLGLMRFDPRERQAAEAALKQPCFREPMAE